VKTPVHVGKLDIGHAELGKILGILIANKY